MVLILKSGDFRKSAILSQKIDLIIRQLEMPKS